MLYYCMDILLYIIIYYRTSYCFLFLQSVATKILWGLPLDCGNPSSVARAHNHEAPWKGGCHLGRLGHEAFCIRSGNKANLFRGLHSGREIACSRALARLTGLFVGLDPLGLQPWLVHRWKNHGNCRPCQINGLWQRVGLHFACGSWDVPGGEKVPKLLLDVAMVQFTIWNVKW